MSLLVKQFLVKLISNTCCIIEHTEHNIVFKGIRVNNIYMLNLNDVSLTNVKCLVTVSKDLWLWHRRLAYVNFDFLNKVV